MSRVNGLLDYLTKELLSVYNTSVVEFRQSRKDNQMTFDEAVRRYTDAKAGFEYWLREYESTKRSVDVKHGKVIEGKLKMQEAKNELVALIDSGEL